MPEKKKTKKSSTGAKSKTGRRTGATLRRPSRPTAKSSKPKKTTAKDKTPKNLKKKPAKKASAKRKVHSKSKETIKKGVRKALLDFYTVSLIFVVLLVLSSTFLLYQWKDFWITEYAKDINRLQSEIFTLTSELSHNQATVNSLQQQVEKVAPKKLGLTPSIKEPIIFKVDQEKLEYYVRKDEGKAE